MTAEQITALKCAYADLVGALQAHNQQDMSAHDWEAHYQTIRELEAAFPAEIEPVEVEPLD
jgi:hypothetical protein